MSKALRSRISKILASVILLAPTGLDLMPNAGDTVFAMEEKGYNSREGYLETADNLVTNYSPIPVERKYQGSMVLNVPKETRPELEQTTQPGQTTIPYIMGFAVPFTVLLAWFGSSDLTSA